MVVTFGKSSSISATNPRKGEKCASQRTKRTGRLISAADPVKSRGRAGSPRHVLCAAGGGALRRVFRPPRKAPFYPLEAAGSQPPADFRAVEIIICKSAARRVFCPAIFQMRKVCPSGSPQGVRHLKPIPIPENPSRRSAHALSPRFEEISSSTAPEVAPASVAGVLSVVFPHLS